MGEFDFIKAKAQLAVQMNANLPNITDKAQVVLVDAYHPLLFLYHKESGKKTIPVTLTLDEQNRILVISGPNAGGKTVTMKTIGLNQLMLHGSHQCSESDKMSVISELKAKRRPFNNGFIRSKVLLYK